PCRITSLQPSELPQDTGRERDEPCRPRSPPPARPATLSPRLLSAQTAPHHAQKQPTSPGERRLTSNALLVRRRVRSPSTILFRSTAPRTRFCRAVAAPELPGVGVEAPASDMETRVAGEAALDRVLEKRPNYRQC
ncbi:hypothetical protein RTBOTA2_001160, partial [Rhodotorula toruloides]